MTEVVNHNGILIKVGDKIQIISEYIGKKALANVELGEVLFVTGISEDGKILYHHNSLALPVNCDAYTKLV